MSDGTAPEEATPTFGITLRDILWTAAAAVGLAVVLKIFIVGAFTIPSHSMEGTLLPGDYIVVSKLVHVFGAIERGDVVVFRLPADVPSASKEPLIKRVIALGGDTVRLTPSAVYVNGIRQPAPPESIAPQPVDADAVPPEPFVVPNGHVYVMGDNRANSYDSRSWGFLPDSNIEGRPLFIYWSYGRAAADTTAHVRFDRLFHRIR